MKKKFLSAIIALMPILESYNSFIPNVDIATFLAIVLLVNCIIENRNLEIGRSTYFLPVYLYVLVLTPILIIANYSTNIELASKVSSFFRWGKFMLFMLLPMTAGFQKLYSEQIFLKTIKWISYFAITAVIIQTVSYHVFGIVINNPFANFATSEAYNSENYTMLSGNGLFRPSAFFLEPSHLTQYVIFYLVFTLFNNENTKKIIQRKNKIIEAAAIIIGIFCTGSGMGYVLTIGIVMIYIIINARRRILLSVILTLVSIIAVIVLYRIDFVQNVFERIITSGTSYGGNAVTARIGNGYQIYKESDLINKLFGFGYGHIPVNEYLNGFTYCLIALGFFGTTIFIGYLLRMYKGNLLWKKVSIIVYFILMLFAQKFTPSFLIFFCALINKDLRLKKLYNE